MMKRAKILKRVCLAALGFVAVAAVSHVCFRLHATSSPQWEYAESALNKDGANYDLRYMPAYPAIWLTPYHTIKFYRYEGEGRREGEKH